MNLIEQWHEETFGGLQILANREREGALSFWQWLAEKGYEVKEG